ncbi:unnamed protein product [Caenorhabditis angaria]|uniref:STI1 domain-containing protein n=1 Tax=Caenorhabditis angaria TaxID=860376 RepID=A0A9P1IF75_9PELO|nr:unnamed protein product [Caenorhabditis angaria]
MQEYNRAVERRNQEIEIAERRERVRKAQEANRKAAEEAAKQQAQFGAGPEDDFDFSTFGGGGAAGGMPKGAADLFSDPEIAAALQDPEILPALMDIMSNPANMMKYLNNPKVAKLIAKLQKSGGFPGFGGPGGAPTGGCPGGGCTDSGCSDNFSAPPPPSKAPEPDLD